MRKFKQKSKQGKQYSYRPRLRKLEAMQQLQTFTQWFDDNFPGTIPWYGQDPAGANVALASNRSVVGLTDSALFPGSELLPSAGGDPMHVSNWTPANDAILSNPSPSVLRVTYGGSNFPSARQNVLTVDDRYQVGGLSNGDGTSTPAIKLGSGNTFNLSTSATPATINIEGLAITSITLILEASITGAGYVEFTDLSLREANPLNADAIGALSAQAFSPNIPLAWYYINDDYLQLPAATLDIVFDGDEFTIMVFWHPADGTWGDATTEGLIRLFIDVNNTVDLRKGGANRVDWSFVSGTADKTSFLVNATLADTDIFQAMTVSKSAGATGEKRSYLNGVQVGATLENIGTWSGGSLDPVRTVIGALVNTPDSTLNGLEATVIIHPTRPMTPSEILTIERRFRE